MALWLLCFTVTAKPEKSFICSKFLPRDEVVDKSLPVEHIWLITHYNNAIFTSNKQFSKLLFNFL